MRVLQVRPIAQRDVPHVSDAVVAAGLREAKHFVSSLQGPVPFALGSRTSFSVMSDWNPAEIIGTKPSRLSFSLYRRIITDETWARQRAEYGYRDVRPACLIVDILGHPYVDVRVDFNSFIPRALSDDLAGRLVDHHLEHLARHPELHDKVEFDILFTCWTFDFDTRAQRLAGAGFSPADITALGDALRGLTALGIRRASVDHDSIAVSARRYQDIACSGAPALQRAYLHLENARVYGALSFSHLARAGFVAMSLLRSLVTRGLLEQAQVDAYLASMRTISTLMQLDARCVADGEMSWPAFVGEYGHLRPAPTTSGHLATTRRQRSSSDRWSMKRRSSVSSCAPSTGIRGRVVPSTPNWRGQGWGRTWPVSMRSCGWLQRGAIRQVRVHPRPVGGPGGTGGVRGRSLRARTEVATYRSTSSCP